MDDLVKIKNRIREIIIETLHLEISLEEIEDEMPLVNGGLYLDSIASIKLILALEEGYGICFDGDDISLNKNNSVTSLACYISKKLKA